MERNLTHSTAEYVQAARRMMYFTKAVDLTLESLYCGPALDRAVWRYEALWLPILAAVSDPSPSVTRSWANHSFATKVSEIRAKNFAKGGLRLGPQQLVPPLDIAWVWHVHRLHPQAYAADLNRFSTDDATSEYMRCACATTIWTAFRFSDGEDAQSSTTRRLWDIIFPLESFMPKYLLSHTYEQEEIRRRQQITSYTNEMTRASFRSVLQYDLIRAANLQKTFLYQIVNENDVDAGEKYETSNYLYRAFQRYLQFLVLHERAPETFLVPMIDINIIWHMHLSATAEYEHDCNTLVGRIVPHDSIAVDEIRKKAIAEMEAEQCADGNIPAEQEDLEENELADLMEKRRRGVAIKETKTLWETTYGSTPRYDLPDTCYRGEPLGKRGGFKEVFEKMNGVTKDISWSETLLRILLAIIVLFAGVAFMGWAFVKAMFRHGMYLLGLPAGLGLMGIGVYIFFAIPISRPLSSDSRYWQERSYKQTHDPLPPYLVSSSKKGR